MIKHIFSGLLLSTSIGMAYAGEMGEISKPYDFGGFYLGLETGFGTFLARDYHTDSISTLAISQASTLNTSDTAIAFEGNIGLGKMLYANTYLGAKASIYYSPIETLTQSSLNDGSLIEIHNSNQAYLKPIYNIDAVLGYEIVPHLLPFVEAGVSFSNVNTIDRQRNVSQDLDLKTADFFDNSINSSGYKTGFNVGMGSNYQLNQNWYISSELLYTYLGKNSASNTVPISVKAGTQTVSSTRTHQLISLMAGISYLVPNT